MPRRPRSPLDIGTNLLRRPAYADRALNRRKFLAGLAGSCGVLALSGATACSRLGGESFRRRIGISIPYEAEILNEFCGNMHREAEKPETDLRIVVVDAEGDFFKQTIDIELFIAQGFGGVFMFVLPEGMDQIVARARQQGVCIFNHSASPITGCTQNIVLDQHVCRISGGERCGQMDKRKAERPGRSGLVSQT